MAAVTVPVADHRGLVRLEVTYDDATVVQVGETADADLIRFILTNTHTAPVTVVIRRSGGRGNWREGIFAPGVHNFDAGGPVRRFSDLDSWLVAVRWVD